MPKHSPGFFIDGDNMEHIRLSVGGILKSDIYKEDTKTWDRDVDVTKAFFFALSSVCELEQGVTLKDICALIDRVNLYQYLSPLLTGGMWLQDIVKEGLLPTQGSDNLDNLVIEWASSTYSEIDGIKDLELRTGFSGIKNGETDKYALDLTPISKINNIPLKLNNILDISDESSAGFEIAKQTGTFPSLLKCRRQFTLYDILLGIFWELSFHGGPKQRDERVAELAEQLKKIENGQEKTFTLDEVKAHFKEKICKKCSGEGWVWWNELEEYDGPANQTGDDSTKYTCDTCGGTGKNKEGDK